MFYKYSEQDQTALINIRVKAGAKQNAIDGVVSIDDKDYLKISINAVPENGKANDAIIKFLAKSWKLKQKQIEITHGLTSNIKVIKVSGLVSLRHQMFPLGK